MHPDEHCFDRWSLSCSKRGNERISPNPSTQIANQKSNTVGERRAGRPGVPQPRFRAFR